MTLNERHYQQQINYKNITTGLKPIEVNARGGDDDLYQLCQHRECKESWGPESDEDSEAFGVRLLFSGFAFLDVPDDNGTHD